MGGPTTPTPLMSPRQGTKRREASGMQSTREETEMRDTILCILFFVYFGLQVASCEAGIENERLAQLGIGECPIHDCWE